MIKIKSKKICSLLGHGEFEISKQYDFAGIDSTFKRKCKRCGKWEYLVDKGDYSKSDWKWV